MTDIIPINKMYAVQDVETGKLLRKRPNDGYFGTIAADFGLAPAVWERAAHAELTLARCEERHPDRTFAVVEIYLCMDVPKVQVKALVNRKKAA